MKIRLAKKIWAKKLPWKSSPYWYLRWDMYPEIRDHRLVKVEGMFLKYFTKFYLKNFEKYSKKYPLDLNVINSGIEELCKYRV